jgi:hypothetical protein
MRFRFPALVFASAVTLLPIAAWAQAPIPTPMFEQATRPPARPPARPSPAPGLRAFYFYDQNTMAAADTFNAAFGTSEMTAHGGGIEILSIWDGLFARFLYSVGEKEGSRAVVVDGEPISVGIPLTVRMAPAEFGMGWRFVGLIPQRIEPYAGISFLRLSYREQSEFSSDDENIDESFNGYSLFGGIDVTLADWVNVGVEAQYRGVPNALGKGGLSAEFGESDLGGTTVRFLVGIRR